MYIPETRKVSERTGLSLPPQEADVNKSPETPHWNDKMNGRFAENALHYLLYIKVGVRVRVVTNVSCFINLVYEE